MNKLLGNLEVVDCVFTKNKCMRAISAVILTFNEEKISGAASMQWH
jgi:hypothetical protein